VKVVRTVYWRKAGPDLPLLLVVIKPLGYRLRKGSKLLSTASLPFDRVTCSPQLDRQTLLQAYIDPLRSSAIIREKKVSFSSVCTWANLNPQPVGPTPPPNPRARGPAPPPNFPPGGRYYESCVCA